MKQYGFGALNTTWVHGTQSAPATVLALAERESRNNLTLNATLNVTLGSDSQSSWEGEIDMYVCDGGMMLGQIKITLLCHLNAEGGGVALVAKFIVMSLLVGATVALHQHNHNRFVNMLLGRVEPGWQFEVEAVMSVLTRFMVRPSKAVHADQHFVGVCRVLRVFRCTHMCKCVSLSVSVHLFFCLLVVLYVCLSAWLAGCTFAVKYVCTYVCTYACTHARNV
ncbi:unnamed protein product [Symbiodinium sp. CCMP2456]|nr:unnamed protein product [Symbiodinium sp. CCMP2456]